MIGAYLADKGFMVDRRIYNPIPSDEEADGAAMTPQKRQHPRLQRLLQCLFFSIVGLLLALTILWATNFSIHSIKSPLATHDANITDTDRVCGHDSITAQRLGCRFNIMNWHWLPPDCWDDELTQSFLQEDDWRFWADAEGTIEVTDWNEMGNHTLLYTSFNYHIVHCIYGWKELHRAMLRGGAMTNELESMFHTNHCGMVLRNRTMPLDTRNGTRLHAGFPTYCRKRS